MAKLLTTLPPALKNEEKSDRPIAARLLMKVASESGRPPAGSGAISNIEKRLPMGGGLRRLPPNAATVLAALNNLLAMRAFH